MVLATAVDYCDVCAFAILERSRAPMKVEWQMRSAIDLSRSFSQDLACCKPILHITCNIRNKLLWINIKADSFKPVKIDLFFHWKLRMKFCTCTFCINIYNAKHVEDLHPGIQMIYITNHLHTKAVYASMHHYIHFISNRTFLEKLIQCQFININCRRF